MKAKLKAREEFVTPDEVQKLLEKATKGEWYIAGIQSNWIESQTGETIADVFLSHVEADAALIASAPSIAKAYLESQQQLQAAVETLARISNLDCFPVMDTSDAPSMARETIAEIKEMEGSDE